MKAMRTRCFGLLLLAPVLFAAQSGCGGNDRVVSMGGNQTGANQDGGNQDARNSARECTREDCRPAIGMPNWECADGGTGGPVCTRQAEGNCAWEIVDCPPKAGTCDQIPQCQFPCADGMKNPIDQAGCVHTCECVPIECSLDDCGPRPGMPNWQCPDGTTAGPSCSAGADGACAWQIIECPPDGDPCANIAQCDFSCPPGTKNPVDERGCTHTCQCVACSKDEIAAGKCGNVPDLCANKACGAGCHTGTRVNAEGCTRDGQCEEANYASCTCTNCQRCTVNGCADQ